MALSQGDFNRLVDDHGAALYRTAYRMLGNRHDAEDVVQETFRSVWRSRKRYQPGRGDRAWLMSILRRRLADRWRRRTIPCVSTGSFTPEAAVTDPDPTHHGYADEVQQALDRLPAKLREALLLVVVGELTHQEAADELGVPLGTVLSRVSRARRQLRDLLLNNPPATGRTAEGEPATVPLKGQPKQRSGGA